MCKKTHLKSTKKLWCWLCQCYTAGILRRGLAAGLTIPSVTEVPAIKTFREICGAPFGDPLEILLLDPKAGGRRSLLGMDLSSGQKPQLLAPRGWWQGSRPLSGKEYGYSLVSTSMAPAYMDTDPIFGSRSNLVSQYPEFTELITSLTRE